MFVSSYNTYILPTPSETKKSTKESATAFSTKAALTAKEQTPNQATSTKLPINFISDYKVLKNQQKLQEQTQQFTQNKFVKINTLQSAQVAYKDNSSLYSFIQKPKAVFIKSDTKLPDASNIKMKMVNTYIENDNYYKITA
ncbi:hypothetical protein [Sulfurimonas sp.]|uniref:hypothetical protein n=1 Tax=Sulfurimonas sp. TaxID=2022749 RepID=UPI002627855A|nr:hypothetical protein [Sulfurimonas sp.]